MEISLKKYQNLIDYCVNIKEKNYKICIGVVQVNGKYIKNGAINAAEYKKEPFFISNRNALFWKKTNNFQGNFKLHTGIL